MSARVGKKLSMRERRSTHHINHTIHRIPRPQPNRLFKSSIPHLRNGNESRRYQRQQNNPHLEKKKNRRTHESQPQKPPRTSYKLTTRENHSKPSCSSTQSPTAQSCTPETSPVVLSPVYTQQAAARPAARDTPPIPARSTVGHAGWLFR